MHSRIERPYCRRRTTPDVARDAAGDATRDVTGDAAGDY